MQPVMGAAPQGSIPACTGKPYPQSRRPCVYRVYPRVYGETFHWTSKAPLGPGLSPRVRGNLAALDHRVGNDGSIPACTGKPGPGSCRAGRRPVYPRVYGETSRAACASSLGYGLSPRVRGNRALHSGPLSNTRSIPACTGKPPERQIARARSAVYPRVYGETARVVMTWTSCKGLSPRVRGNPQRPKPRGRGRGSIPACTGKPHCMGWRRAIVEVYPRVYGETSALVSILAFTSGLSPRVRGNRTLRPISDCDKGLSPRVRGNLFTGRGPNAYTRSIPACTGKPLRSLVAMCHAWVYPRVYGETPRDSETGRHAHGLSPRVRGNLRRAHPDDRG